MARQKWLQIDECERMLRDVEYLPQDFSSAALAHAVMFIHTWDVTLNLPNIIVRLEMEEDMTGAAQIYSCEA
jgi:hypothetical protein